MKRTSIVLAAAALAAVTMIVGVGTGTAATSRTIKLDAKLTATKRIDAAPHGYSAGDHSLAAGALFAHGTKKRIGSILLDCTDMPAQTGECELTLALRGGHVAVLASYGKGFSGKSSAHDPIAGGTGSYAAARGYTDEVETGDGAMSFTLHLNH